MIESAVDIVELQPWIGRREAHTDVISRVPVAGLSATLGYPATRAGEGELLPPLWHWLFFLASPAASELDRDGHARRGGFMPPVPLPRRMWAASDIDFREPIFVGDTLERASSIEAIEHKQGRSGELVFVTLLHEVFRESRLAIRERQRLVYRQATTGVSESPMLQAAPAQPLWSRTITPDPVLLFRYSALTFNSHRIHYGRDYATRDEGYGGLVVQGPLTAMLLLDSLWREAPDIQLKSFSFRGVRPLLDDSPVRLQGRRGEKSAELWALDAGGALAMKVSVTF